jgi:C4-type Zn-finger protein
LNQNPNQTLKIVQQQRENKIVQLHLMNRDDLSVEMIKTELQIVDIKEINQLIDRVLKKYFKN